MSGVQGGPKRMPAPLELKLQMAMSNHVGAGNSENPRPLQEYKCF